MLFWTSNFWWTTDYDAEEVHSSSIYDFFFFFKFGSVMYIGVVGVQ